MCIICIKPAGVQRPTKEQLNAMLTTNPDGFGYMTWSPDKGLQVRKTMDAKKFIQWVENIPDEQPVVYHARIATHGSIQECNCHPFLSADQQWGFAHNGILTIQNEGDMTDSETFFRRIAEPLLAAGYTPTVEGYGAFDAMVASIIGSSKFVFMNNEGSVFHYGNFIEDGGLLFSNSSYKPYDYGLWFDGMKIGKLSGKKSKKKQTTTYPQTPCSTELYYDLVEQLYNDMLSDGEVWRMPMYDLYEEYAVNYPVSWDDFSQAYDEAEALLDDNYAYEEVKL